jgi:hypothetical protein
MARMQRSLFAQLNALAEEIAQSPIKSAADKSASPVPADPGGYQGASSHPTTTADNGVQNASTGARASEYAADIKKQQGALAVDNTPELSQEGRQDEVQTNIGLAAKATGEDPANEKDFKGTKDDPGTSSPVKADDGEKYSTVTFKEARERAGNLGNDILANLINFGVSNLQGEKAAEMPAFLKEKMEGKKEEAGESAKHEATESPAAEKAEHSGLKGNQHKLDTDNDGKIEGSDLAALRNDKAAAFKAGYELAAHLGLNKEAAEASVRDVCANTLREADEMADLFIGFVTSKSAAADPTEEAAEGEDHSAPGDADSGMGDAPAAAPAGLEAMMGGEGDAPDMAPEETTGGEPSEDEAVQELAMALQELGIPPEALLQALSQGGQGGGDAAGAPAMEPPMDPAMAGADPKMAAANDLNLIGHAVVNFKRAGKFQIKEARTKRSRELRDMMKQHVLELVNR